MHKNGIGRQLHEAAVALFAFPQFFLRQPEFGHVLERANHAQRLALLVEDDFALFMHVAHFAVRANDAVIDLKQRFLFYRLTDGGLHALPILGIDDR